MQILQERAGVLMGMLWSIFHYLLFFFNRFFVPRIWLGRYNLNLKNFSIAKVWCFMGLYWPTRCCNLAAHSSIHASFVLRRGLTRFQLPKGFLGLRIIECRNSSDIPLQNHSLLSIHLNLLSCWVESTPPFTARVVDSHPSCPPT